MIWLGLDILRYLYALLYVCNRKIVQLELGPQYKYGTLERELPGGKRASCSNNMDIIHVPVVQNPRVRYNVVVIEMSCVA